MASFREASADLRNCAGELREAVRIFKESINTIKSNAEKYADEELELIQELLRKKQIAVSENIVKIVEEWYGSYTPKFYNRRESLKKAYLAELSNNDTFLKVAWGIDSGKLEGGRTDSAGPEYMDWLIFQQGYHGGAAGGPDHPSEGIPYYRKPYSWSRPAVATFPLNQAIEDWINAYDDAMDAEYNNRARLIAEKYGFSEGV